MAVADRLGTAERFVLRRCQGGNNCLGAIWFLSGTVNSEDCFIIPEIQKEFF